MVSRRQYLIARNKDKTAFIQSQPYFPDDIDETKGIIIAESMTLRNLPLNHVLVEPGSLSDKVGQPQNAPWRGWRGAVAPSLTLPHLRCGW